MLQFWIFSYNAHTVYHVDSEKANPFVKICTFTNNYMAECGSSPEDVFHIRETAAFFGL